MIDAAFWGGKRVFLTGHTGFKGSWLSLWLQSMGAEVTGYSLPAPTSPSLFDLARVAEDMTSLEGDVRDYGALEQAMRAAKPDIVIHMAAQPLVRLSYREPVATYATNVMGTVHVLEAIRQLGTVRSAVMVTTDKCYENREWVWGYREDEPMGGHDPYSNSKGCAELVTSAYRKSFFTETGTLIASARAGNVIGGGDWAEDRLIPDLLRGFIAGETVKIRSPHAIRPWQHVLEPLSGYLLLAQRLFEGRAEFAEAWNFGPRDEDAKPVSWIVERLVQLWGPPAAWELDGDNHPHEAHYLKLDLSKAVMKLGWQPRWTLSQTLERIVGWYSAYRADASVREATLADIAAYSQSLNPTLGETPYVH